MTFTYSDSCRLCNSQNVKILIRDKKHFPCFLVLKCKDCGIVFLKFYSCSGEKSIQDEYWTLNGANINIYSDPKVNADAEKRYEGYLRKAEEILGKKGKLLDFGCGIGNFINIALKNQWEACGIDISPAAVDFARNRFLNVYQGNIEESDLSGEYFDVITMWDVIEHLEDPVKTVSSVCDKLKTDGLLIIETPAEGNIIRKIAWVIYRITAGKISLLPYFYYSVHRFYFSTKTMERLLSKLNMDVMKIFKESTFLSKAKLKIQENKLPFRKIIMKLLPLFFSRMFGIKNKMVIIAKKKSL